MNRILADTNILVTALGWPHGVPARALWRIVNEEHLVLTEYVLDEFRDVIGRKFPAQAAVAEQFLAALDYELLPVATSGVTMRDETDQPILDAALAAAIEATDTHPTAIPRSGGVALRPAGDQAPPRTLKLDQAIDPE